MNPLTVYLSTYFDELDPVDFYREIFPVGELEKRGLYIPGMYNGILVSVTNDRKADGKPLIHRYTVTDDLDVIRTVCSGDDFCLMSPISYAGKQRTAENARFLYALAIDLDKIKIYGNDPSGLRSLLERHIDQQERLPKPTFIVSSGTGVHLYYVFDHPIAMYEQTTRALQQYKHELTRMVWHDTICDIKDVKDVQQEGIYQGFRVPGTITKVGDRARVFRVGDRVTMEYMNGFVRQPFRVYEYHSKQGMTLAEARAKFPEWYERRVEKGEPRGKWHISRRVYEWWKCQIMSGATVGHRYYCIMMLAVYAKKCSLYDIKHNPNPVTRDELERDAFDLLEHMEKLTVDSTNHFTTDDIMQALQAFDERWMSYPRSAVEYKSGIRIEANKRNGRTQVAHLARARAVQNVDYPDGSWRNDLGRPTAQKTVESWQQLNPMRKKADCIRETGLSKKTVYKWWRS